MCYHLFMIIIFFFLFSSHFENSPYLISLGNISDRLKLLSKENACSQVIMKTWIFLFFFHICASGPGILEPLFTTWWTKKVNAPRETRVSCLGWKDTPPSHAKQRPTTVHKTPESCLLGSISESARPGLITEIKVHNQPGKWLKPSDLI